jgi:hypothetical protein
VFPLLKIIKNDIIKKIINYKNMKAKNITKQTLTVPGVGIVKPEEIVEVPEGFNNANFQIIKKEIKLQQKNELSR